VSVEWAALCCLLLAGWQVFSQYREHGVLLWRGFSFDDFANQVKASYLELSG
jgi:TPP-dependent pyruvate/acetoin dehydrogenase alpha subunit